MNSIAELLQGADLPIREVNSELSSLTPLTKAHALACSDTTQPGLSLCGYAVLGVFPQSSTALYQDFAHLIERAESGEIDQGIVDNLLETPGDPEPMEVHLDPPVATSIDEIPAQAVNIALPCDPSQFAVLREAQTAECTVVRGPPGTGKSQVIANMIIDALSRNERVLVVCQKRAALDVVRSRLESTGLDQWSYVVHDATADRNAVYAQLRAALQKSQSKPSSTKIERLNTLSTEIDRLVDRIRAIVEPLRTPHHGRPLGSWYRSAPPGCRVPAPLPPALVSLPWQEVQRVLDELEPCLADARKFFGGSSILDARKNLLGLSHAQTPKLLESIETIIQEGTAKTTSLVLHREQLTLLQTTLAQYRNFVDRWWRLLAPGWWRAKKTIKQTQERLGTDKLEPVDAYVSRSAKIQDALTELETYFHIPEEADRETWLKNTELSTKLRQTKEHLAKDLDRILSLDKRLAKIDDSLQSFLVEDTTQLFDCVGKKNCVNRSWRSAVEQNLILHWLDLAEAQHPSLRGEPFAEYHQLRATLEARLAERASLVSQVVTSQVHQAAALREHSPEQAGSRARPETLWNKLEHQLSKKRQLWPLRRTLETFKWPLRRLAPCWLLSPEVAAEILPLERELFDVVIFDEASQLRLERALPVLYRAKRVVVAGDEQQMPPSNFFALSQEDGEDAEVQDDARTANSLLEQSKKIYGFRYLQWHYRSLHGELIDFSNQAFYDGALHITPGPTRQSGAQPFVWHQLPGIWEQQTNAIEAEQCAKLIVEIGASFKHSPRSVGVITVNAKQKDAIEDAIDRLEKHDPQAAVVIQSLKNPSSGQMDDRLFVKNIENVQGDERDIIIFCSSYARSASDRTMRRNFGAIGLSGGENRLNVAFTRSREQMHVMCSFDPSEIPVHTSKNRGPKIFMAYLQYARALAQGRRDEAESVLNSLAQSTYRTASDTSGHALEFDSDFEVQVYEALVARGLSLDTQVGAGGYRIDLAVVDPGDPSRYCLAIECDGASYHSGASVRERDIARQALLENRGWTFERIWSRDWWRDPNSVLERIMNRVSALSSARAAS